MTNTTDQPYTVKKGDFIGTCHVVTDSQEVEAIMADPKELQVNSEVSLINKVGVSDEMIYEAIDSGVKDIKEYDFSSIKAVDDEMKGKLRSLLINILMFLVTDPSDQKQQAYWNIQSI